RAPHRQDQSAGRVVAENRLHFQEVFKAVVTPLTAITGLLVAAEGRVVVQRGAVQVHHAGTDLASHAASAVQVGRGYVAGQAITGVVGDADGVGLIFIADDRQYRPEDFFAGDGHVGGHMAEDGRLNIVALVQPLWAARAADYQVGTFFDSLGDQLLDLAPLGFGYDRANGGIRGVGRAGLDLGSNGLGNLHDFVH